MWELRESIANLIEAGHSKTSPSQSATSLNDQSSVDTAGLTSLEDLDVDLLGHLDSSLFDWINNPFELDQIEQMLNASN